MEEERETKIKEEREYFYRLIRLVVDVGTEVLLKVFKSKIGTPIKIFLKSKESKLKELKKSGVLVVNQLEILNQTNFDETKLDISLLYTLLRNLTDIQEPNNGWNACLLPSDMSPGACLTRLKDVRNEAIAHRAKGSLAKAEFEQFWKEASVSLVELAEEIGSGEKSEVQRKVDDCETQPLLRGDIEKSRLDALLLKWDLEKRCSELEETCSELKSKLDTYTDKVEKQDSRCENSERDIKEVNEKLEGLAKVIREVEEKTKGLIGVELKRQMKENWGEIMSKLSTVFPVEIFGKPDDPITNPNALAPESIVEYSQEIGPDWKHFAGYLGFTQCQIDTLKEPHGNKFAIICEKMLQKWHEVVARSDENPKELLAAAFLRHDDHCTPKEILGNELNKDEVRNYKPAEETKKQIQKINFAEEEKRNIHEIVKATIAHIYITINQGGNNALNQFGGNFENKANINIAGTQCGLAHTN